MRFTLSAAGINPFFPQYSSLIPSQKHQSFGCCFFFFFGGGGGGGGGQEILGKKCVNHFVYRVWIP